MNVQEVFLWTGLPLVLRAAFLLMPWWRRRIFHHRHSSQRKNISRGKKERERLSTWKNDSQWYYSDQRTTTSQRLGWVKQAENRLTWKERDEIFFDLTLLICLFGIRASVEDLKEKKNALSSSIHPLGWWKKSLSPFFTLIFWLKNSKFAPNHFPWSEEKRKKGLLNLRLGDDYFFPQIMQRQTTRRSVIRLVVRSGSQSIGGQ